MQRSKESDTSILRNFFKRMLSAFGWVSLYFAATFACSGWVYFSGQLDMSNSWHDASRERVGTAVDPAEHPEALVQVYTARAYNWKGLFGTHPWIALKPKNADNYEIYEVVGWQRYAGNFVRKGSGYPDRNWFGNPPNLLLSVSGEEAEKIIPKIRHAVESYPFKNDYKAYPGPNSNTFMAYVASSVPELGGLLRLPPTSVGQRYSPWSVPLRTESERNMIFLSLGGHAGLVLGTQEGVRFFLFGVEWGINPWRGELILPSIGLIKLLG